MPDGETARQEKRRLWCFFAVSATVLLCFLCSQFFYQLLLIQGNSMEPAYHNWQIVVIDRLHHDYRPGDVVAFRCSGLSSVLVKRIAAEPGDLAEIRDGKLLVNGEISPVFGEEYSFAYAGLLEKGMRLDSGFYCVIGDNTDESRDSRYKEVGAVGTDSILGRIVCP